MKNLITFILVHLVDHPNDVEVIEEQDHNYSRYMIKVNPEDMGKVIGRKGKIIQSIRNIAKIRAIKEHRSISINLLEVEE